MPHMQGCHAAGKQPIPWAQPGWNTLLIPSQHRHSQAAQPQMNPIQMLLDEALWKMVRDLLALQTSVGDWRLLAREVQCEAVSEERQGGLEHQGCA